MKRLFLTLLLLPSLLKAAGGEGVSAKATELFKIADFPVTNSVLTTWIIALLIIVAVRITVGTPKLIPGKGQSVIEGMAQGLRDALEPIVGKKMIGKVFPPLLTDMLAVGEETGDLPGALKHIARRYDSELDQSIKVLTTVLEPVLILGVAVVVGFVAISMLTAVFDLTSGLGV